MNSTQTRRRWAWGFLLFGVVYGVVVAVMIITGALSTTLWFTVAAMAMLAASQALNLRAISRTERRERTHEHPEAHSA
ncbi:hypothetical protein [Microbacterium sp. cf332]|uniref:hypothetical protein n=1 Tax=Microbacterium sp. cf332 TaxID=1761804 RepID=UPI0008833218|nr:hypothetical protein [Microbacterium sp. cf332]SDQ87505.1 hypothetical protein SAMN04487847_2830 [Microbacterium sp. cf332]